MMDKGTLRRSFFRAVLPALALLFLSAAAGNGADPSAALSAAGWEEHTPGRWNSLPERKVEAAPNRISGEFVLPPGSGVSWEKKGAWTPGSALPLSIEFSCDATNPSSKDYKEFGTRFPVSVTAVFGKESQDITWRRRFLDFFRKVWNGFTPGGIRLVYAWGNNVPVGSMYRTGEEETVFILAGEEEKGKTVSSKRNLKEDFMAAYGRYPKGPVTGIVVSAERPSKEKGKLSGRVAVTLPGP